MPKKQSNKQKKTYKGAKDFGAGSTSKMQIHKDRLEGNITVDKANERLKAAHVKTKKGAVDMQKGFLDALLEAAKTVFGAAVGGATGGPVGAAKSVVGGIAKDVISDHK